MALLLRGYFEVCRSAPSAAMASIKKMAFYYSPPEAVRSRLATRYAQHRQDERALLHLETAIDGRDMHAFVEVLRTVRTA